MILFLLSFLLIYGSVHLYIFYRVRKVYKFGRNISLLLGLLLLLEVLAPVFAPWLGWLGFIKVARIAAYVGYIWMGYIFYVALLFLLFDAFFTIGRLIAGFRGLELKLFEFGPRTAAVLLISAMLVVGYGFWEAENLRLERVVLSSDKLPPSAKPLRIALLSDLHLGLIVRAERLKAVVETIRKAEPDILVAAGDLIDGRGDNLSESASLIRSIPTKYGKFAVMGNHELYTGIEYSQAFLQNAGFVVLRDEFRHVAQGLIIVGVDDMHGVTRRVDKSGGESQLMDRLAGSEEFVLLLKHTPRSPLTGNGSIDLQLSGHLHKGQIFPFGAVVNWVYSYPVGELIKRDNGYLYISRGAGTWGPPIRVLAPPEITLVELRSSRELKE